MNIIKKVMVFVMGVVVIGITSTAVGVATKTKPVEKSITFELDGSELAFNVYDQIKEYAIFNEQTNLADNLVNILLNGDGSKYEEPYVEYYGTDIINISDNYDEMPSVSVFDNNTYSFGGYQFNQGDVITVTFAVEVGAQVFVKTLLLLIPLVLSASLIGYLAIKVGDEQ